VVQLQHALPCVKYTKHRRNLLILGWLQVTASNPAEVIKTRLQLQGELAKDGGKKVYHSAIDALVKTWKNEGLRGVQRGLTPAVSAVFY
jgi:Mitochondrial carrier protein